MEYIDPSVAGLQHRLRTLIQCPIDWSFISCSGLRAILDEEWLDLARRFSMEKDPVDAAQLGKLRELFGEPLAKQLAAGSTSGFFDFYRIRIETETDPARLRAAVDVIEAWTEDARQEYRSQMAPLAQMHFATDAEYHKHFPLPTDTVKDIRRKSLQDSCFYHGVTRDLLTDYMWEMFEARWDEIWNAQPPSLFTDAMSIVGADKGEDTSIICWKIDFSKSLTHAYPLYETMPAARMRLSTLPLIFLKALRDYPTDGDGAFAQHGTTSRPGCRCRSSRGLLQARSPHPSIDGPLTTQ